MQLSAIGHTVVLLNCVLLALSCSKQPLALSLQPIHLAEGRDLQPPLELIELLRWRDGGSLGFVFRDAQNMEILFCLDRQVHSSTEGRWFIDATHPTHSAAQIVDFRGTTEAALIQLLKCWISQHFDEQECERIRKLNYMNGLEKDRLRWDAWIILGIIQGYKMSK